MIAGHRWRLKVSFCRAQAQILHVQAALDFSTQGGPTFWSGSRRGKEIIRLWRCRWHYPHLQRSWAPNWLFHRIFLGIFRSFGHLRSDLFLPFPCLPLGQNVSSRKLQYFPWQCVSPLLSFFIKILFQIASFLRAGYPPRPLHRPWHWHIGPSTTPNALLRRS